MVAVPPHTVALLLLLLLAALVPRPVVALVPVAALLVLKAVGLKAPLPAATLHGLAVDQMKVVLLLMAMVIGARLLAVAHLFVVKEIEHGVDRIHTLPVSP